MSLIDQRESIQSALKKFKKESLLDSSLTFFESLGYQSGKQLRISPNTLAGFQDQFPKAKDIKAISNVRIIDHACGSGTYPMGALHRLVDLLQKLDPNNETWKREKLADARKYHDNLRMQNVGEDEMQQVVRRIEDIEKSFDTRFHELDYARKLYLIEECLYGVDIQPVACQIAKLRFFIALIVDQKMKPKSRNLGVTPMPNLETKIVAANALLPIDLAGYEQTELFDASIQEYRNDLLKVRHQHFEARAPPLRSTKGRGVTETCDWKGQEKSRVQ